MAQRRGRVRWLFFVVGTALPAAASAFFFIIPIPNLAKPPQLNALIEALEKSDETKAVAYVSEDKTFGSKYWVWGHYAGHVTQEEADRVALSRCQASLANAKSQAAGGKQLYDFGSKTCELYDFQNKTVSTKISPATQPAAVPVAASHAPTPAVAPASLSTTTAKTASPETPASDAPQAFPTVPPYPYSTPQTDQTSQTSSVAPPDKARQPPQAAATSVGSTATSSESNAPRPAVAEEQLPAATPMPQQQTQAERTPAAEGSTARRLRELNDLLKQGLITDSEYAEKRKAILSAL